MKSLNLRKVEHIKEELTRAINNIDIKTTHEFEGYLDTAVELKDQQDALEASVQREMDLTAILFNIRKQVGQVNATSGINDILCDVALVDRYIGIYQEITQVKHSANLDLIQSKLERVMRENSNKIYEFEDEWERVLYAALNRVSEPVVPAELLDQAQKELKEYKRKKRALQDKLLNLNIQTEIQLEDREVKILEEEGIL